MTQGKPILDRNFEKRAIRVALAIVGLLFLRAILGALPMVKNASPISGSLLTPLVLAGVQPHQTPGSGIHRVDFQNFHYRPACLAGRTVSVSNGQWQEGTGPEMTNFVIASVTYGSLIGHNPDEAAVLGACGGAQNFQVADLLIFSMSGGGPRLLTELSPQDWGKGEEDNGGAFPVSGVRISRQQLAVSFLAGGSHACPQWTVTAAFRWNGNRLVRTGVIRKPYTCP